MPTREAVRVWFRAKHLLSSDQARMLRARHGYRGMLSGAFDMLRRLLLRRKLASLLHRLRGTEIMLPITITEPRRSSCVTHDADLERGGLSLPGSPAVRYASTSR